MKKTGQADFAMLGEFVNCDKELGRNVCFRGRRDYGCFHNPYTVVQHHKNSIALTYGRGTVFIFPLTVRVLIQPLLRTSISRYFFPLRAQVYIDFKIRCLWIPGETENSVIFCTYFITTRQEQSISL